jgi:hypothetical protein
MPIATTAIAKTVDRRRCTVALAQLVAREDDGITASAQVVDPGRALGRERAPAVQEDDNATNRPAGPQDPDLRCTGAERRISSGCARRDDKRRNQDRDEDKPAHDGIIRAGVKVLPRHIRRRRTVRAQLFTATRLTIQPIELNPSLSFCPTT